MSVKQFLEEVARRGSWVGGGSVAACAAALSAALLEKLVAQEAAGRRLRRIRHQAARVIEQDATAFARVVGAMRRPDPQAFRSSLKAATALQMTVWQAAQEVQRAGRIARRSIKPKFQSDLRCAMALAEASAASAKTLIHTNLAWLNNAAYTRRMARQLRRG